MRLCSYLLTFKPFSPHTINPIVRAPGSSHRSRHLACQQTIPFAFQGGTADGMKPCCWLEIFGRMVLPQPCSHLLPQKALPVPKRLRNILRQLWEALLGRQQRKARYCLSLLLLWHQGLQYDFFLCTACWGIKGGTV